MAAKTVRHAWGLNFFYRFGLPNIDVAMLAHCICSKSFTCEIDDVIFMFENQVVSANRILEMVGQKQLR